MELKFYYCEDCDNMVILLKNSGVPVVCCGQKMKELVPGTTDASAEKHVPVYEIEGNKVFVKVGSAAHPMEEEHFIEMIALQGSESCQYTAPQPGQPPEAAFVIKEGETVEAVYAYCNLHGLWKA